MELPTVSSSENLASPSCLNFSKDNSQRFSQNLNMLRRQARFCDVVLIAGSSPEEQTEADSQPGDQRLELTSHRVVLAAACPYFQAMFGADMAESCQREIYIQGVHPSALQLLIDYIYTRSIQITEDNVQLVLPAANLLQLNEISLACSDFLKSQLHASNCLGIRGFADLHSCRELLIFADNFIEQHFNEVVQTEEFVNLNLDQFVQLISNDRLTSNEEAVFEAVMHWVRHDVDRRRYLLAEIMEHVRLPLLSQEYLIDKVESDPLVREDSRCKDYLIEALKFHLMRDEQKKVYSSPRTRPRTPQLTPKLLVVVGGQAPKAIRNVDAYDLQSEQWQSLCELPMRRCRCGVCTLNGLVYAVGGFNGSLRVRSVDAYDPLKDVWVSAANMDVRRATLGVGVMEGEIYAVGGFDGSTGLNSAEAYDPRCGQWRQLAPMSTRRSSVGVAVLNGCVYAVGGYDGLSRQCLYTVERYDRRADRWASVRGMAERRSGPGVATIENRMFALGGHDGPSVKRSVETYDADVDVWRPAADMVWARRNAGVCALGSANNTGAGSGLLCVGGDDGNANLASVELYDPGTNSWSMLPVGMQIGRSYSGVAIVSKSGAN